MEYDIKIITKKHGSWFEENSMFPSTDNLLTKYLSIGFEFVMKEHSGENITTYVLRNPIQKKLLKD